MSCNRPFVLSKRCKVSFRWLATRVFFVSVGLFAPVVTLTPMPTQIAAAQPHLPLNDFAQFTDACLSVPMNSKQLDIPAFFSCVAKMLTMIDWMAEDVGGGSIFELTLALRYPSEELMATLVLWGLTGQGPPLDQKTKAQLASQGGPLLLRFLLLGKARGLDAAALRPREEVQAAEAPQGRQSRDLLDAQVREYLFYDWRGPSGGDPASTTRQTELLKTLGDRVYAAEDRLGSAVHNRQQRTTVHPSELTRAVASRLQPGSALVEIIAYRPLKVADPDLPRFFQNALDLLRRVIAQVMAGQRPTVSSLIAPEYWGAPHYLAAILFPDQRIVVSDLGETGLIDREVAALYDRLSSPSRGSAVPLAQTVYRRIFGPLLKALGGARTLYLSLDGNLHMVPFDALHDGKRYLIDTYEIIYLNSGRDLLRSPTTQPGSAPVVLAARRFGPEPPTDATGQTDGAMMPGLYGQAQSAPALRFVDREAEEVAALLPGARVLKGEEGSEKSLRQRLRQGPSPRVLHIAAHAVFQLDRGTSIATRGARSGISRVDPATFFYDPSHAPIPARLVVHEPAADLLPAMSRAALLLGDAAVPSTAAEVERDGILTALEVRWLPLQQTQLAVLSACETGAGARTISQGVYGFRRAFSIAGVRSLVMSLWQVHDGATRDLMRNLYQRLARGTPCLTALHKSMRVLKKNYKRYEEPFYWAPFIGIGDNAPVPP